MHDRHVGPHGGGEVRRAARHVAYAQAAALSLGINGPICHVVVEFDDERHTRAYRVRPDGPPNACDALAEMWLFAPTATCPVAIHTGTGACGGRGARGGGGGCGGARGTGGNGGVSAQQPVQSQPS
eukprot:3948253-Prymnesium_polylepis.1